MCKEIQNMKSFRAYFRLVFMFLHPNGKKYYFLRSVATMPNFDISFSSIISIYRQKQTNKQTTKATVGEPLAAGKSAG